MFHLLPIKQIPLEQNRKHVPSNPRACADKEMVMSTSWLQIQLIHTRLWTNGLTGVLCSNYIGLTVLYCQPKKEFYDVLHIIHVQSVQHGHMMAHEFEVKEPRMFFFGHLTWQLQAAPRGLKRRTHPAPPFVALGFGKVPATHACWGLTQIHSSIQC